ncbi:MAG: MFS transporter [Eubacteriales bacterium]
MEQSIQSQIKRDNQVKKFCLYGFLKNLKFFEPYLLVYLMSKDITLLEIGILMTIRELVVNLLEIPSGIIADYYGRKKELYLCFLFYIISFLAFFITDSFLLAAIAMIFFGCGEAFRSGSHKAMIYTYLDHKGWTSEKAFTYGRTRSVALIGSAISSIFGIILIVLAPTTGHIFLFSAIPYTLDFLLITTYPNFLDKGDKKEGDKFFDVIKGFFQNIKENSSIKKLLLQEGLTESCLSYSKEFLQPLLEFTIISSGIVLASLLSEEDNVNVILGIAYAIMNLISSFAAKKAHILQNFTSNASCLRWIQGSLCLLFITLSMTYGNFILVILLYLAIFALQSIRKPLYLEEVDNHSKKEHRATVLSVAAQMKSLCLMIFAPIFGYIAEFFGLLQVLWMISGLLLLCFLFTSLNEKPHTTCKKKGITK